MELNDRALLVQLSISQWTARKFDRKATADVAQANNTTADVGRYNKVLLPGAAALAAIHQHHTAMRTAYYENTLPWGANGMQILPTSNYLEFMATFRKQRDQSTQLVNAFVDEYPALLAEAPRRLVKLFDPQDYPDPRDIRSKFHVDLAVMPVPTADFRVSIASDELRRIQQDVEQRVQQSARVAMQDVWQRLHDRVAHMADKLSDPKAIFRDSLVENAREICAILPRLNFTDDPDLERMRQEVEATLLKHPDALRNDPVLRQDTATQAKRIMDAMGAFMGN